MKPLNIAAAMWTILLLSLAVYVLIWLAVAAFAHGDVTIIGCDAEIRRTLHHILEILESGR